MGGHRSFRKIRREASETTEQAAHTAQFARAYRDILKLVELREERGVTQTELADAMQVSQPNISRLERENDIYLSTLANYVAVLGGTLRIEACFPEGTYTLMGLSREAQPKPD